MMLRCNIEPYGVFYLKEHCYEPYGEIHTEVCYTQGFLSEFSGLSVSFISDLENGKKTAELEKAIYLANLLGLDLCLEGREHGS